MKYLFVLITSISATAIQAQYANAQKCDSVYAVVQEMPVFSNGDVYTYLRNNIHAGDDAAPGCHKIIISFIIDKNGNAGDLSIEKNEGLISWKETGDTTRSMPAWKPGKHNGNSVCVRVTLPMFITIK